MVKNLTQSDLQLHLWYPFLNWNTMDVGFVTIFKLTIIQKFDKFEFFMKIGKSATFAFVFFFEELLHNLWGFLCAIITVTKKDYHYSVSTSAITAIQFFRTKTLFTNFKKMRLSPWGKNMLKIGEQIAKRLKNNSNLWLDHERMLSPQ